MNKKQILALIAIIIFSSSEQAINATTNEPANDADAILALVAIRQRQVRLSIFNLSQKLALRQQELALANTLQLTDGQNTPLSTKEKFSFALQAVPVVAWQFLLLLLWVYWLFLLLFAAAPISRKRYLLTLITSLLLVKTLYWSTQKNRPTVTIVSRQASLHAGPGNEYPIVGNALPMGSTAWFLEEKNGFLKIENDASRGGERGWVSLVNAVQIA